MNGSQWLREFSNALPEKLRKRYTASEWTEVINRVFRKIAVSLDWVISARSKKKNESGENLNIDAMFFDKKLYDKSYKKGMRIDPFILPLAIVEHDNDFNFSKIAYCMWKLTLVRSPLRILICYARNSTTLSKLRFDLEAVIKKGNLLKEDKGELIVIVGNEEASHNDPWEMYFRIFEWRNNKLQRRDI